MDTVPLPARQLSTSVLVLRPLATIEREAGHVLANASLFAAAKIGANLADSRQLPSPLARPWLSSVKVSLPVSAGVVILLVLFFPLEAVAQMTSLAFLVVYGAVSAAHLRVRGKTGARAWPLLLAVAINAALFVALLLDTIRTGSPATWITFPSVLAGSFTLNAWLRRGG